MPRPPSSRLAGRAAWAAAVGGPLALYVLSLPRTVVLEDDGLFLMAGAHLGIAHPPGYPLYVWICHAFMQLPFGSPAFLGHLSSAALGALACGFVYWTARLLGASILPALAAAWLFGASEHFWSQAIIAEVYTLNAMLLFATYALLLHGRQQPDRTWPWVLAAAAFGLGLANHWPLMALASPGLLLAALPVWRPLLLKLPHLLGAALPCAALPYAWMVWRSQQNPFISFLGPIESWADIRYFISRQAYAGIDASPSAGWADRLDFLQWFGHELAMQLTLPGFLLALLGLFALHRRRQLIALHSGVLILLGHSLLLILLLQFDFEPVKVAVFRPYPLVCYGLLALWLAVGLDALASASLRHAAKRRFAPWLKSGTAALAGLLMLGGSVHASWPKNNRSDDNFAELYASMILGRIAADAALIVGDDIDMGTLGYFHFVEGRRPDVQLLSLLGLVYRERLYSPFLKPHDMQAALTEFVNATDRAVFFPMLVDSKRFPDGHKGRSSGFLVSLSDHAGPDDRGLSVVRNPDHEAYFLHLLNAQYRDRWKQVARSRMLEQYCHYLGYVKLTYNPEILEPMQPLFRQVGRSYACLIGIAEALLNGGKPDAWDTVQRWLRTAETRLHEATTKQGRAKLHFLKGQLAELQERPAAALRSYRRARSIHPHPDNPAVASLRQLRRAAAPDADRPPSILRAP